MLRYVLHAVLIGQVAWSDVEVPCYLFPDFLGHRWRLEENIVHLLNLLRGMFQSEVQAQSTYRAIHEPFDLVRCRR